MVELLGVGVPRDDGGWLLHRVCARIASGTVTVVVSQRQEERLALLDAVAGRRIPEEGGVWVAGMPVMADNLRRLRARVGEVDLGLPLVEGRSVLWNTLAAAHPGLRILQGLFHLPRPRERQAARRALAALGFDDSIHDPVSNVPHEGRARLVTARELLRRPEWLVIREVDTVLGLADAEAFLGRLRRLVRAERVSVVASAAGPAVARGVADRVMAIAEGLLVFDGPPDLFTEDGVGWRLRQPLGAGGR